MDQVIEVFTWLSWALYLAIMIIGLPGMYDSISEFLEDEDTGLALFAFLLPVLVFLGWGVIVYYAPLLSGAVMAYFVADTLGGSDG
jgi:amino acid transporter